VSAHEAFVSGQERGLPMGVINSPEDLLADGHFEARRFFVETEEEIGAVTYPGAPFRFSAFEPVPRSPAPKLEQDATPS
jgi:crotonobetainyl-CoA:carnitine CoA-transferase CaiB-like acyl-CoA transferase